MDAAIEATKAVIAQTRKVKQGLLQTLLTRGVGHTKFKDSPLGEIPETWAVKTMGDLTDFVTSGSRGWAAHYADSGALFVRITNLNRESIYLDLRDSVYVRLPAKASEGTRTRLQKGDILISITAELGMTAVIPDNTIGEAYVNQHIALVRLASNHIHPHYLAHFIASHSGQKQLSLLNDSGTKAGLNLKSIRKLQIAVPPYKEQQDIVQRMDSIDAQINTETEKLASLQQLKKGMMQDLLTGKVRVPVGNQGLQLVSDKTKTTAFTKKVQPAFKRAVLAAEITHQLYQNPKFGSVKQEKIIDLCERHLDLDAELDRTAYRQAAGPYDNKAKRSIESNFKSQKWFEVKRATGQGVKYLPLTNCGQHKPYFDRYFGHISADIQSIINLLKDLDTERCEIVATLYAAWNDFLIKGETPDDDAIVNDVLNNWHDKKKQIPKDRWLKALPWMRQQNLVPRGCGRETKGTKS